MLMIARFGLRHGNRLSCVDGGRGLLWYRRCNVDFGSGGAVFGWLIRRALGQPRRSPSL